MLLRRPSLRKKRYGGTNDVLVKLWNGRCPMCGQSCDTHAPFPFLRSDGTTEELARRLQQALDHQAMRQRLQGRDTDRGTTMVGAATARIGSRRRSYLTLSGAGVSVLGHLDRRRSRIPNDVQFVDVPNAAPDGVYPSNPRQEHGAGREFRPVPAQEMGRGRDYSPGACAAPKLLAHIHGEAHRRGEPVTEIRLSEILWYDSTRGKRTKREWSTGELVESCDTCKQIVPQMLCSALPPRGRRR